MKKQTLNGVKSWLAEDSNYQSQIIQLYLSRWSFCRWLTDYADFLTWSWEPKWVCVSEKLISCIVVSLNEIFTSVWCIDQRNFTHSKMQCTGLCDLQSCLETGKVRCFSSSQQLFWTHLHFKLTFRITEIKLIHSFSIICFIFKWK